MYLMNIFEQIYLKIINESSKDIIKYNNFPEDDINITNKISKIKYIDKITLTKHCINSNDITPHGINYLNIPEWKFFKIIEMVLFKLLNEYDIHNLSIKSRNRFYVYIYIKSLDKNFLLIFDTFGNNNINGINVYLITIYEIIKPKTISIKITDKGNLIKLKKLSNIYIESIIYQNLNWLSEIIVD